MPSLGGLPPEEFLVSVDPLLAGVREKLDGEYATSDQIAGTLSERWAKKLGLKPGIPIPVGAFDAHWDAIGAGCADRGHGERGRHVDVHYWDHRIAATGSGSLRRGAGKRASAIHGNRSGTVGGRRHL